MHNRHEDKARILIVDDEEAIRRYLRTILRGYGYAVSEAAAGLETLERVAAEHPDVIILDLGLPDIDGCEVIRRLREWSVTPIIVLSVRDQELDKITALDSGANDYLTKPFSAGELLARLRVALRPVSLPVVEAPRLAVGDLAIDFVERSVTMAGKQVHLTPREYDLLRLLARNAGRVMTHQRLLREVWGEMYEGETHLLRVNISNLRRKIEPDPSRPAYIVTEPAVGYRFRDVD